MTRHVFTGKPCTHIQDPTRLSARSPGAPTSSPGSIQCPGIKATVVPADADTARAAEVCWKHSFSSSANAVAAQVRVCWRLKWKGR